jgi:solute carrier family 9 (sodium/hydrogen exchanger), member 8
MFRKMHFLTHSSAVECCLILFYGLCSYTCCEIIGLSGVISILVAGIVLAHYNFYNISPTGQITTGVFLATLALFCEAFIYIYLGVSSFQERGEGDHFAWSWTFTLLELLITIVSRVASIVLPSFFFRW